MRKDMPDVYPSRYRKYLLLIVLPGGQRQGLSPSPHTIYSFLAGVALALFVNKLNRSEPLYRIRILLDEIDQQRGLGVRPGPDLLPVFERADVCAEIDGRQGA